MSKRGMAAVPVIRCIAGVVEVTSKHGNQPSKKRYWVERIQKPTMQVQCPSESCRHHHKTEECLVLERSASRSGLRTRRRWPSQVYRLEVQNYSGRLYSVDGVDGTMVQDKLEVDSNADSVYMVPGSWWTRAILERHSDYAAGHRKYRGGKRQ